MERGGPVAGGVGVFGAVCEGDRSSLDHLVRAFWQSAHGAVHILGPLAFVALGNRASRELVVQFVVKLAVVAPITIYCGIAGHCTIFHLKSHLLVIIFSSNRNCKIMFIFRVHGMFINN